MDCSYIDHSTQTMKSPFTAARIVKLTMFGLGVLLLILIFRNRPQRPPDVCPLDGQTAEWSTPQDADTCDYGHFSTIEKTTHTWSAPCENF